MSRHAELPVLLSRFLLLGPVPAQPDAEVGDGDAGGDEDERAGRVLHIYPLMQVANISMPGAHLVPVGDDQLRTSSSRETSPSASIVRWGADVFPAAGGEARQGDAGSSGSKEKRRK